MGSVDQLYRWLSRDTQPTTNATLGAALRHAEPEYAVRIALMLLDRRHESAWVGLVAAYDRLGPKLRERLLKQAELLRAGIAGAMKDHDPHARLNALAVLRDWPCAQLSYLAADALRDESPTVRAAAAKTLSAIAQQVQRPGGGAGPNDRAELGRALREGLRTFDAHECAEVLQVCLWFAAELGDTLWEALADQPSRRALVVAQHLLQWNEPRLAPFLQLALGHQAWREAARDLLETWREPAQVVALLRNAPLLSRADFRHGVRTMPKPRWFLVANQLVDTLPPDARALLPQWVCQLGFTETERMRCLERWQASEDPELHRAAVYALAHVGTIAADRLLAQVAKRVCPMARFAKWFLIGKHALVKREDAAVVSARPSAGAGHMSFGAEVSS